ncbi:MAG: hypothetical protein MUE85_12390 [Microscillaceae bacterium]|jgi:predicted transposase/invertase (TIGR01784 family)|nr:hypothetical protein [Microscillaceae bacterium]
MKTSIHIKQDSLWKGIIEDLFADFLLYFYPEWASQAVDFTRRFEFLDKELDEIFPTEKGKKRYADKLVKVFLKSGVEQWLLVHIEVQGYQDPYFPERMFNYFYRIRDRWQQDILAMALLTDNDPTYHPSYYTYHFQKTKLVYEFDTFKLLDKKLGELHQPSNPFSVVMLVARQALEKSALHDSQQLIWKKELVLALRDADYAEEKIRKILNFIRYYVKFEKVENLKELDQNIQTILQQRKNMGIEEIIIEEIREQAFEEGEQLGLQKGEHQKTIKGVQKALKQNKLSLAEIADLFEVSLDFVIQVQKGEIK